MAAMEEAGQDIYWAEAALAALAWQLDLGADEAIAEAPVDRFAAAATDTRGTRDSHASPAQASPSRAAAAAVGPGSNIRPLDVVPAMPAMEAAAPEIARKMATRCTSLEELRNALAVFEHCALKKGARNLVFADGVPGARVMVIGEAPGRDEDRIGRPFVGRAGQLLDRMFAAIGLSRSGAGAAALYITNVVPWRPPQNRDPDAEEIAMMLPFLERHIELAAPDVLVLMGNTACKALLGRAGITRMRGRWTEAAGRPCLPMFHPAALLRDPIRKRDAWSDLLSLKARLA